MEESKNKAENKPGALPVPPWKIKSQERTLDIKAEPGEKVAPPSSNLNSTKKLKRIGVMSMAKAYGVMGLVMGLVIALVYGVIFFVGRSLAGEFSSFEGFESGFLQAYGIVFILAIPFIYAIFGFISGAIAALGFNVVLKITGGIELEFGE